MSLKDTIRGAREEAQSNLTTTATNDTEDNASEDKSDAGFVRRSPSRAKPRRQAAAGVRTVSGSNKSAKPVSEMTKEEKKAEKQRKREKEDREYAVSEMLMENDPDYQQYHKMWWRILIVGFVAMVISMVLYGVVTSQGETAPLPLAIVSLATMVIAYAAIIAAFVYDWRKIRPIRISCQQRAASMSEKRINKMLRERDK